MRRLEFSRRLFLRGTGVALALPLLDAFVPLRVRSADKAAEPPRRMLCINTSLGLHAENFFPSGAGGKDYELSPYLEQIKEFRDEFTVFSGLSHPEVDGGHNAEASYLTAAPHPKSDGFFRNSISLDQYAIEQLVPDTRFQSLVLASSSSRSLSYTRNGVMIPAESRPSVLFKKMFVEGTAKETEAQVQRLQKGQSIMDMVRDQAKSFEADLGARDREKLDEYFTSVREVERRLVQSQEWTRRPKPKVDAKPPVEIANAAEVPARVKIMIDMMHLALQTDSTRVITFALTGLNAVPIIDGVNMDWHNASHHGKDPAKLDQLKLIELEQMRLIGTLLGKLKSSKEQSGTLLDRTTVMFGSNLGNASSHDNKNLPILVAGGSFKHGQHLAFDPQKNPPLCNLYVQMLQQLGLHDERFGSSAATAIPGFAAA